MEADFHHHVGLEDQTFKFSGSTHRAVSPDQFLVSLLLFINFKGKFSSVYKKTHRQTTCESQQLPGGK